MSYKPNTVLTIISVYGREEERFFLNAQEARAWLHEQGFEGVDSGQYIKRDPISAQVKEIAEYAEVCLYH